MSWCLIRDHISFQKITPISADLDLEGALTVDASLSPISILVLWSLPSVFLLDVDVQKLLFNLFSCYLICFVLILENIGLAELQKGYGVGKRKTKERKKKCIIFCPQDFCAYLSRKNHTNKWFKCTLDLLSKKTWKVCGFWSIKQTAQSSWWGDPLITQTCIFPMCGWRLQAALKEQGRMQNDPKHHWFFCLA